MTRSVPLYERNGSISGFALVDDADYDRVAHIKWHKNRHSKSNTSYATYFTTVGDGKRRLVSMHRVILDLPYPADTRHTDHINGNGLDNRRKNLRIITHAENMQNRRASKNSTSRFRGVYWDARDGRWIAQVRAYGKRYRRYCQSEDEAAKVASELRAKHLPFSVEISQRTDAGID